MNNTLTFFNFVLFCLFDLYIDEHDDGNRIRIPSSLCNGQSYPLGMESGEIRDHQIAASSSYNLQSVGPQNAR